MSVAEERYKQMVRETLGYGIARQSRAGDTVEAFGMAWGCDMMQGFPLFTGRKMYPGGVMGELKAFLTGASSLAEFKKHGCNYWDHWARDDGSLGPVYGVQWRQFTGQSRDPADGDLEVTDQLAEVKALLIAQPDTRRAVVTAWSPNETSLMALPPCHYSFQFRRWGDDNQYMDLLVNMRSLDVMVGFPSDVLLYAMLLKLMCNELGTQARQLIFHIGSCHIYQDHIDSGAVKEYLSRGLHPLPKLVLPQCEPSGDLQTIDTFEPKSVKFQDYQHGEPITLELKV